MQKNLPVTTPAEVLTISPEALEVANCYLQLQSIDKVVDELEVPREIALNILSKPEVKAYINNVFMNMGFNNRFKMRAAMDAILEKKFQEMDEAGVGSSKDIAELMALSHKMTMDQLDREIQLEKLKAGNAPGIKSQVNVQINDAAGGSNYGTLIERIISNNV